VHLPLASDGELNYLATLADSYVKQINLLIRSGCGKQQGQINKTDTLRMIIYTFWVFCLDKLCGQLLALQAGRQGGEGRGREAEIGINEAS
jgi:hypothetical protein